MLIRNQHRRVTPERSDSTEKLLFIGVKFQAYGIYRREISKEKNDITKPKRFNLLPTLFLNLNEATGCLFYGLKHQREV